MAGHLRETAAHGPAVFVKICGITRAEDAVLAAELGAGAIGFIFWPGSPRFIDPARARDVAAALPPTVATVGVFVNDSVEHVNEVARIVELSAVQLHGDETPAYASRLERPALKAVPIDDRFDPASLDVWPARTTILLDVHDPARRGGTGRTVDWRRAAEAARRRRVILAGGLAPENVNAAIAAARPFGIDVSSGVEARPGIKDPGRLRALFEAINELHGRAARS